MSVDEFALRKMGALLADLVKEQVTQSVMDECILIKLHDLRHVRLTTTDDHCTRIGHSAVIQHLLWPRFGRIKFIILIRGDRQVSLRAILGYLLGDIVKITGYGAGHSIRGAGINGFIVATYKHNLIAVYIKQQWLSSISHVTSASIILDAIFIINVKRLFHSYSLVICKMIAGELHHVSANISQ